MYNMNQLLKYIWTDKNVGEEVGKKEPSYTAGGNAS
jgi:hypothetical protein